MGEAWLASSSSRTPYWRYGVFFSSFSCTHTAHRRKVVRERERSCQLVVSEGCGALLAPTCGRISPRPLSSATFSASGEMYIWRDGAAHERGGRSVVMRMHCAKGGH